MAEAADIQCCDRLPQEIENRAVLDIEGLRPRCVLVPVPDPVESRYYRCTNCGQLWMERIRVVPLAEIVDTVKVWSVPQV